MNAAAIQTSDDEFGYDFETDDEELLIQLATNASLPPKQTDAVALITAASTAKQTIAGLKASQHVKSFHERVDPREAPALGPGNKGKAPEIPVWDTDQKRAASSAHDPVAYPDCEHKLASPSRMTDEVLTFYAGPKLPALWSNLCLVMSLAPGPSSITAIQIRLLSVQSQS